MGFCKTWLNDSSEVKTDGVCPKRGLMTRQRLRLTVSVENVA